MSKVGFYVAIIIILSSFLFRDEVIASLNGITGRTLKTSTRGCSCHGSTATPSVIVTITGPDTVILNQTTTFNLTITGGPAIGGGCDIATRNGTLSPVSASLKLSNGELTHVSNTAMTSGSVTFQFNYVYTGAQTIDTLFAIGLSTNSNGGSSGDQWNWAISKKLVIITPSSVNDKYQLPNELKLEQNYPNPFNPNTTITYSLPEYSNVQIAVYNLLGVRIATLVDGSQEAGDHSIKWEPEVGSGIYYYQIKVKNSADPSKTFTQVRKMLLLK